MHSACQAKSPYKRTKYLYQKVVKKSTIFPVLLSEVDDGFFYVFFWVVGIVFWHIRSGLFWLFLLLFLLRLDGCRFFLATPATFALWFFWCFFGFCWFGFGFWRGFDSLGDCSAQFFGFLGLDFLLFSDGRFWGWLQFGWRRFWLRLWRLGLLLLFGRLGLGLFLWLGANRF